MKYQFYLMKLILSIAVALFSGFTYIYMSQKGFSDSLIGQLIFFFWLFSLIFEIPSGMLSDYFGRRVVFCVAMILRMIGLFTIASSHHFFTVLIGFSLAGIADAFSSGCLESWIFDSISKGEIDEVSINSARIRTIFNALAGAIGVKLFGITSGETVFYISIALLGLNFILSLCLIREKLHSGGSRKGFFKEFQDSIKIFIYNDAGEKTLLTLFVALLISMLALIPGTYYQLLFKKYSSVNKILFLTSLLIPFTAFLAQTLYKKIDIGGNEKVLNSIVYISGFSIIVSAAINVPLISLLFFLIHVFFTVLVEVFLNSYLNKKIETNRNSILSTLYFTQSLISTVVLFLISLLLNLYSIAKIQVVATLLILLSYTFFYYYKSLQNRESVLIKE